MLSRLPVWGVHLLKELPVLAAKKGLIGAADANKDDIGNFWSGEFDKYYRDVVNPGVDMLWDERGTDYNVGGFDVGRFGKEMVGEQLGLLKYVQDRTVQPWIDLAYDGYKNLRDRRSGDTKNARPSTRGAGTRVSKENKGSSPFVQNRPVRSIPIPARVPRYRSK